jgi:hypothetical protein
LSGEKVVKERITPQGEMSQNAKYFAISFSVFLVGVHGRKGKIFLYTFKEVFNVA